LTADEVIADGCTFSSPEQLLRDFQQDISSL
jgi:hypothetical protein